MSVILPFGDVRGDVRHLDSWTRGQSCPEELFEIIALTDGSSGELAVGLKARLRPEDRVVTGSAGSKFPLYAQGARAAKGILLLFSEDHCVAEPDCLDKVIEYFDNDGADGAFLRSGHINRTNVSRMEQHLYEEAFEHSWSKPDCWDKVRIRGFAVHASAYESVGGLDHRYGYFSESLLAAKLDHDGFRLGYIPGAEIKHVNVTRFKHLYAEIREYAWGECLYRDHGDPAFCERYLLLNPNWSERATYVRATNRRACAAIWRTLWRHGGMIHRGAHRSGLLLLARELAFRLPFTVLSTRLRALSSLVPVWKAKAGYYFAAAVRSDPGDAFHAYWAAVVQHTQLAYYAEHQAVRSENGRPASSHRRAADLRVPHAIGFHTIENWNGTEFRWSGPVALVYLNIPRRDYWVTIDTGAIRGPDCGFLFGLFFNEQMIPPQSIRLQDETIVFPVAGRWFRTEPEQRLMIVCGPLNVGRGQTTEHRKLGLPVVAIDFRPRGTGQQ